MSKSQTSKTLISYRPNATFLSRLKKLGEAWGVSPSVAAHRLAIVAASGFDQGLVPEFAKFKPYVRQQLGTDPFLATVMHFRNWFTELNAQYEQDGEEALSVHEEAQLIFRQLDHFEEHGVENPESIMLTDPPARRLVPSGDVDERGRSILRVAGSNHRK